MKEFVIKNIVNSDIEFELGKIGFDIAYRNKAKDKFQYKTFKIYDLTLPQANILKQTALIFGADCGVHREVLTNKINNTDAILGGSISQLKKICQKLKQQPFSLSILADKIEHLLTQDLRQTKIVGILNLTPNSFSNDGVLDKKNAIKKLYQLIEDGADIIDIGAESTKPFAKSVDKEEQIRRLSLVINEIQNLPIPISIDTRCSEVAKFALDNGAKIINDVSGLEFDIKMIDILSEYNATLILQHSIGDASNIIEYHDVVEDVYKFFLNKIKIAKNKGVNNIILDVGIGFSKTKSDNIELLNRIEEFYTLECPIMVGISRKSFLGVKEDDNFIKDALTLSLNSNLISKNVDYLRVHNVKLHKQLLNLVR